MDKLLILLTFLGWGLWHIFSKLAAQRINPLAMQFIWACCSLITLPFYYVLMAHKGVKLVALDIGGISWALVAFCATSMATVSYSICLTTRNVSDIVSLASAYPVLVCLLAIPIFGESFTWQKFAGILLVWFGIFVLSRG